MSLQEKFQVTLPGKINGGEGWTSFESQRYTDHNPTPEADQKFNKLPIDSIDDGCTYAMPVSLAGKTDVTDQLTAPALDSGFTKLPMKGTDDQYTGEHCDLFYGDAGGFAERNNYMDRE